MRNGTRASTAIVAGLLSSGRAHADERETTYETYHGNVYGSDGSKAHRFGGDTYITDGHGHETKCHEFAGKVTCRGDD